mmetsp:Transcript_8878/g.18961  ORF Transcript_8878/g.18961 Transcript_8878/m.18961 type:complete len:210 (+) Transcript_8878:522-1151(+)
MDGRSGGGRDSRSGGGRWTPTLEGLATPHLLADRPFSLPRSKSDLAIVQRRARGDLATLPVLVATPLLLRRRPSILPVVVPGSTVKLGLDSNAFWATSLRFLAAPALFARRPTGLPVVESGLAVVGSAAQLLLGTVHALQGAEIALRALRLDQLVRLEARPPLPLELVELGPLHAMRARGRVALVQALVVATTTDTSLAATPHLLAHRP